MNYYSQVAEFNVYNEEDWIVRNLLINNLISFGEVEFYKRVCLVAITRGQEVKNVLV